MAPRDAPIVDFTIRPDKPDKPDSRKLSGRIVWPDSGHVKSNMPSVYVSINAPS